MRCDLVGIPRGSQSVKGNAERGIGNVSYSAKQDHPLGIARQSGRPENAKLSKKHPVNETPNARLPEKGISREIHPEPATPSRNNLVSAKRQGIHLVNAISLEKHFDPANLSKKPLANVT